MTSKPSTSSAGDSRASQSPSQASAEGKRTSAGSGPSSHGSFAWYDLASCSWRTSQGSLLGGWEMFSETWPRSGSTHAGTASRRQPSVPLTSVTESSWLPTPTRQSYGYNQQDSPGATVRPSLDTMAKKGRWPTPHGMSGPDYDGHGNELSMAVRVAEGLSDSERSTQKLWPTPLARDWKGPDGRDYGNRSGASLPGAVGSPNWNLPGTWPTPKSSPSGPDYARAGREDSGGDDLATAVARRTPGQLNPTWVEWLMGFPLGWTDSVPSATPSSRRSPSGSGDG